MNRIGMLAMFAIAIPASTLASNHWASPVHCDFTGPLIGAGYSCELVQSFGSPAFSPSPHNEDVARNEEFVDMMEFNLPPEFENIYYTKRLRSATMARYSLGNNAIGAAQLVDIRVVYANWHWQLHVVELCAESLEDVRNIAAFAFQPNENAGDGYEPVTLFLTHEASAMWSELTVQFRSGYGPLSAVTSSQFPADSRMMLRRVGALTHKRMPASGELVIYFDPL